MQKCLSLISCWGSCQDEHTPNRGPYELLGYSSHLGPGLHYKVLQLGKSNTDLYTKDVSDGFVYINCPAHLLDPVLQCNV